MYCIICYMFCDRNNSIVFRVAREYVKKETLYNEFSNNIIPLSIQNNLLTYKKRTYIGYIHICMFVCLKTKLFPLLFCDTIIYE